MVVKLLNKLLLTLLLIVAFGVGNAQAELLDVGPVVEQANPSTYPTMGHGFPLWYRDTNRMPLQLCVDKASGNCLIAEPNTGAALSFPNNMGDELFWYVADAEITTGNFDKALLVQAIEAAFSTGDVVPGAQVSFARIRIRFEPLPVAGEYIVTTPYKQFIFNVTADNLEINHTEDIGISEGGIFTGALNGSIGPFLYCKNAVDRPAGFIGNPGNTCEVLGSTYTPLGAPPAGMSFPANYFRIQGPNGFDHFTNQFSVMGKLYTDPIPTPLTVDKLTYARDTSGVQVNAFATTQATSNQVNGALAFPANFALTNAPSELHVNVAGISTQIMATNNPEDGKFFDATGPVAFQGELPANGTVTNVADTPDTVKIAPLVDEIKISNATYNPTTRTLTINAQSLDTIANPTLQAFMSGLEDPLGNLAGGQLSVNFPVDGPDRTFNIPTEIITVKSSIGGSATTPVITFLPVQQTAVTGISVATTLLSPQTAGASISVIASASGGVTPYEYEFWLYDGLMWSIVQNYSTNNTFSWSPVAGAYKIKVHVRSTGSKAAYEARTTFDYVITAPAPATALSLTPSIAGPLPIGPTVFFNALPTGNGNYEYAFFLKQDAGAWTKVQDYSKSASWTWNTSLAAPGTYSVEAAVRQVGSLVSSEVIRIISYELLASSPATSVTLTPSLASPRAVGTTVVFNGQAVGTSRYEYAFFRRPVGGAWQRVQDYGPAASFTWNTAAAAPGAYQVEVAVRQVGSQVNADVIRIISYTLN